MTSAGIVHYTIIVDKPEQITAPRYLLSPRRWCRALLDLEPSSATTSVYIDSKFSESVYELYTKTCTTWGGEYLNYTGTTPKFLRDSTWWPIARADNSRTVISRWPSSDVETCALWLMDPLVDPISGLTIDQPQSREYTTTRERLRVWAELDLEEQVFGENRREVYEVVRLCQKVLGLPKHEFEYRLERLLREDQL